MLGSAIWKCMSEMSGIPSPYKSGAQNYFFRQLHNLTATLKAYIFGMKHDIDNQAMRWQLEGVSYIVSE